MTLIGPNQIANIFLFMAVLGLLWLAIRMNRHGLTKKLNSGKRIIVAEITALGPQDRAMILTVDHHDYLVLRLRGAPPVITALPRVLEPEVPA